MNIILDFDNTIFAGELFLEAVRKEFIACGVLDTHFQKLFLDVNGLYAGAGITNRIRLLSEKSGVSLKKLEEKLFLLNKSAYTFLYSDTVPFLGRMASEHNLTILTFGEDVFQRTKITGACLEPYVTNVVVTDNIHKDKEASEISNGKPAVFVEDNPIALSRTKRYAPHIATVRMQRSHGRYKNVPSGDGIDIEVRTLAEVEYFIKSYLL